MVDRINTYTLTRPRLKRVLGWSFVVLGFVAVIAPIVPGAPLVFVGFELLGLRFLFTDRVKTFFSQKEPLTVEETVPGEAS